MLVKDIMTREVVKVSPFSTIKEALTIMREKKVKSLAVDKTHENDAYGIITYSSVLKAIVAEEGDVELLNVYDIHAKPALYVSENLAVKYVAQMMVNQGIRRLLVVDNNELKGIISMTDIVETIIRRIE